MPLSLHLVLPWFDDTVTTRKRPRRSWRFTSTTSTDHVPISPRTASSRPRADPIAGVGAWSVGEGATRRLTRSGADPSPRVERRVPSAPASSQLGQRRIPHKSRGRPPEAPAHPRESPQCEGRKALLTAEIPAYPRSARKRHDRPVTPEVAGSSPVAPAASFVLQTRVLRCLTRLATRYVGQQMGSSVSSRSAGKPLQNTLINGSRVRMSTRAGRYSVFLDNMTSGVTRGASIDSQPWTLRVSSLDRSPRRRSATFSTKFRRARRNATAVDD